jgi:hypothetical protein
LILLNFSQHLPLQFQEILEFEIYFLPLLAITFKHFKSIILKETFSLIKSSFYFFEAVMFEILSSKFCKISSRLLYLFNFSSSTFPYYKKITWRSLIFSKIFVALLKYGSLIFKITLLLMENFPLRYIWWIIARIKLFLSLS